MAASLYEQVDADTAEVFLDFFVTHRQSRVLWVVLTKTTGCSGAYGGQLGRSNHQRSDWTKQETMRSSGSPRARQNMGRLTQSLTSLQRSRAASYGSPTGSRNWASRYPVTGPS
jgi:hypothetical protein